MSGLGLPALPPWTGLTGYVRFETKVVTGGRAYARNEELPTSAGRHWRHLYERYQAGALGDEYAVRAWSDDELHSAVHTLNRRTRARREVTHVHT